MPVRLLITLFFLLSGATALVYQVIWVRMLGLVVGHSVLAVSTVVATYMAGLGVGARLAGSRAEQLEHPLSAYGWMEVGIGGFALLSPVLLGATEPLVALLGGDSTQVLGTLLAAGLALFPPTLAMGATLPLLTRWYAREAGSLGKDMGWLYAVNTTGAFVGAGLAGFALLPTLGQPASLLAAASVNIAVGLGAVALGRKVPLAPTRQEQVAQADAEEPLSDAATRAVLIAFALSGAAAMVNQVAWSRCFGLFTGSTTYAFSLIVCAFIAGLALGGHLLAQQVDRLKDRVQLLAAVNAGIALFSALMIPILEQLPLWLIEPIAARAGSFGATQLFVFSVLFGLVFLPTLLMGGTYPVATRALSASPEEAPRMVGRAYAWNTAGAIVGSLAGGLVLIPLLELQGTLWLAVGLNLVAAAVLLGRRHPVAWALPAVAAAGMFGSPGWDPRVMNLAPHMYARDLAGNPQALSSMRDSGSILFHEEGIGATVTVLQRDTGARVLRINGKTDASSHVDRLTQGVVGGLPLLLSDERDDVLVIGLGSGMTLAAVLDHPVEQARVVELLPEVIRGAEQFGDLIGAPLEDERTEMKLGDGRHELAYSTRTYDVVSSQPTNMFISGISTLFTRGAFAEMRDALDEGGVALVWVQGYLLRDEDFRTVLRTFLDVFPEAHLWNAGAYDYALTGHLGPLKLDAAELQRRIDGLVERRVGRWTQLRTVADLQRHYLLGPQGLAAMAGDGPIHEDRDPFLEFSAPRGLFGGDGLLQPDQLLARREPLPVRGSPALAEDLAMRQASTALIDQVSLRGSPEELEAALRQDPGHPFARQRLARMLHQRALQRAAAGQLAEAEADVRQVLAYEPQALPSWRALARIQAVGGDVEAAIATMNQAVAGQPGNPYAHLALAELANQAGRAELAAAATAEARRLDPDLPELQ